MNGEKTDARSDLYSMGISLYELVTGQRPFRADSDFAVMVAHLKEMPRPPIELKPELGQDLNELILTSIAKDPAARFQSADDFRAALIALHDSSATVPIRSAAGAAVFPGQATRRLVSEPAPTLIDPPTAPVVPAPTRTVPAAATPGHRFRRSRRRQRPADTSGGHAGDGREEQPALYVVLGVCSCSSRSWGEVVSAAPRHNRATSPSSAPAPAAPTAAAPAPAPVAARQRPLPSPQRL